MRRISLPLLLSLVLASAAAFAATVTLSPGQSIQDAINAAADGDVIVLNPGTYAQYISFAGKDIVVRSTDPYDPAVVAATILNGGGTDSVVTIGPGSTSAAQLKGLTLTNGAASYGGGISCNGASPTITRNIVIGNQATAGGGGIFVQAGAPNITQNVVRQNLAASAGGGILFSNASGGLCMNNQILENHGLYGGGIYLSGAAPELKRNWINDNIATSSGGGLYVIGGNNLGIKQNVFRDNQAPAGGGVLISLSNTRFTNNVLVGNTAGDDGFGPKGGAMYLTGGDNNMVSNTFDANSSGIRADNDTSAITNSIITNCTTIAVVAVGGTLPTVAYTDLWNNAGGNTSGLSLGVGCISTDPMYAAPGSGVFVLKSQAGHRTGAGWVNDWITSPCVDAGPPWFQFNQEPDANGGRVNMGFEGNMDYASRSIDKLLVQSVPANGATGVDRRVKLSLTFQRLVNQASAEAHIQLQAGGSPVTGVCAWPDPNKRMTFVPDAPLAPGVLHSIVLSTGIKMLDNSVMTLEETRNFTTGSQPVVTALAPTGTGVIRSANIVVDFDVAMVRNTTQAAFTITPAAAGVFSWQNSNRRLTFNPNANLAASTQYTVKIAGTARSQAGVQMQFPFIARFTTAAASAPAMAASAAATASGGVQVTVALTEAAEVGATVLNMAGRAVASLPARQVESGVSSLLWNGRSAVGTKVPAGQYLVKVVARTADGKSCSALAPLKL